VRAKSIFRALRFKHLSASIAATGMLIISILFFPAPSAADGFSIVVFPDTQYLVSGRVGSWNAMCDWVVANRETLNTKAVLSVGDVTDTGSEKDFKVAAEGFAKIEQAGIPCVPIVGNHDYDSVVCDRTVTHFDAIFGPEYFKGNPIYGGNLEGSNANYWIRLEVQKRKFLVVCLELFPRPSSVEWASSVIDSWPDSEVIVLTHGYLNPDGQRTGRSDRYGPDSYALTDSSSGEDLWNSLIRGKPNIRAVICGHQLNGPNLAVSQGTGDAGNVVQQIFINYQYAIGAWVGIIAFHDIPGSVDLSVYNTDPESGKGFDVRYPKRKLEWEGVSR